MRIAATYDPNTGEVFQHFGRTEFFKVYEIEDGKVVSSKVIDNGGFGHHDLVTYLQSLDVTTLILGGRGPGAKNAIEAAGLKEIPGVSGSADAAAEAFAKGEAIGDPDAVCNHHGEHHHGEGEEHHCHHEGGEHHCHH